MTRLEKIKEKDLVKECQFPASRSSGPGGQNVNKVNTQVSLRFDINNSGLLDEKEKKKAETMNFSAFLLVKNLKPKVSPLAPSSFRW